MATLDRVVKEGLSLEVIFKLRVSHEGHLFVSTI